MNPIFKAAKEASRFVALLTDEQRNQILNAVADAIVANTDKLLAANAEDLAKMDKANPLYDRLQLTPERLAGIASDMRNVATLPSPLGITLEDRTLPNGLRLRKKSVPFGVIGVIYEARPNVTFDVFSLCLKSGNACILKGGRDADCSNRAAIALIYEVLESLEAKGIVPVFEASASKLSDSVSLLEATHEATAELLGAVGYVDICIPRGGRRLIDFVRDNAKVPVIETGAGVVHAYIDKAANMQMAADIVLNAKTRRVSVCNALDTLLVHKDKVAELTDIIAKLQAKNVDIHDNDCDFSKEFMAYSMNLRVVDSLDEAINHIAQFGSGHSESIITDDEAAAERFQNEVDAACVYVNAPTSFTDGAQFGLGAEIGISTQKLGPRGPMGLMEMTTYKWLINGNGQTRA
ncbi:MAG: glutamate-5-semialdehyde dehydrogenase [Bacteroidaceae bacterium]|nr:glutamate-5-semialdehyde dehydrogenase [Bacteroidaceae bacterium]